MKIPTFFCLQLQLHPSLLFLQCFYYSYVISLGVKLDHSNFSVERLCFFVCVYNANGFVLNVTVLGFPLRRERNIIVLFLNLLDYV